MYILKDKRGVIRITGDVREKEFAKHMKLAEEHGLKREDLVSRRNPIWRIWVPKNYSGEF